MREKQIDKMTFKEFIVISKWTFELLFRISKPGTIFYLVFNILDKLSPVFNAIVFAKALDKAVNLLSSVNAHLVDLIPYIAVMVAFLLLNTLFSFLRTITGNITYHKSKPILSRVLYKKLNELGI